ncbi:MAG: hypothetical protein OHK0046_48060 [Anaerolineae bacterium]
MSRATIAHLILQVREMANVVPDAKTVNGVSYWTDDQIEARLDRTRRNRVQVEIEGVEDYIDGETVTTVYPYPYRWIEQTLVLRDTDGVIVNTGYTVNYDAQEIVFAANTDGDTYTITCKEYDLYSVAADIWDIKAGWLQAAVDWQTDNHNIKASQERDFCLKQAQRYREMAAELPMNAATPRGVNIGFAEFERTDEL